MPFDDVNDGARGMPPHFWEGRESECDVPLDQAFRWLELETSWDCWLDDDNAEEVPTQF